MQIRCCFGGATPSRHSQVIRSFHKKARSGWEPARGAFVHVASHNRLVVVPMRIREGRPIRVLRTDVDPRLIGEAVQAAVEVSEQIDPDLDKEPPASWDELLAEVGLSQRQLARGQAVDVHERADGALRVAVWRYVRGGWEPIGDHAEVTLSAPAPEQLGQAVVVAAIKWDRLSGTHLGSAL
jgi:hypothetical protein